MTLQQRTVIARRLRRDATEVEQLFWRALATSGFPWKFRRQHRRCLKTSRVSSRLYVWRWRVPHLTLTLSALPPERANYGEL
jgi:hypothetical protein